MLPCLLGLNSKSWGKSYRTLETRMKRDSSFFPACFHFYNNLLHLGITGYSRIFFHELLVWIYKWRARRVTDALFCPSLPLLWLRSGSKNAAVAWYWECKHFDGVVGNGGSCKSESPRYFSGATAVTAIYSALVWPSAEPMAIQVMLSVLQTALQGVKMQKPVAPMHSAAAEIPILV